jgi:hypothetical protein
MEKKVTNRNADLGKPRLMKCEHWAVGLREPLFQACHLRRLSTSFAALEGNKQSSHGSAPILHDDERHANTGTAFFVSRVWFLVESPFAKEARYERPENVQRTCRLLDLGQGETWPYRPPVVCHRIWLNIGW